MAKRIICLAVDIQCNGIYCIRVVVEIFFGRSMSLLRYRKLPPAVVTFAPREKERKQGSSQ